MPSASQKVGEGIVMSFKLIFNGTQHSMNFIIIMRLAILCVKT